MKYAPSIYAKAFLETEPEPKRFLQAVARNGDLAKIDKIVTAIEELVTKKHGGHTIALEFARKSDLAEKFKFSAKDHVRVSINPSLVAGVRITIDGEQELDESLQRKLNNLWHTKS